MNPRETTKELQRLVLEQMWGVVTLDRGTPLPADLLTNTSIWIITERLFGKHKDTLPSKEIRKLIWRETDNRWFKEGRGVVFGAIHPDTRMTTAGLGILISKEKGQRMRSMNGSDVYIDREGLN